MPAARRNYRKSRKVSRKNRRVTRRMRKQMGGALCANGTGSKVCSNGGAHQRPQGMMTTCPTCGVSLYDC